MEPEAARNRAPPPTQLGAQVNAVSRMLTPPGSPPREWGPCHFPRREPPGVATCRQQLPSWPIAQWAAGPEEEAPTSDSTNCPCGWDLGEDPHPLMEGHSGERGGHRDLTSLLLLMTWAGRGWSHPAFQDTIRTSLQQFPASKD